ncbi:uncharacterized protein LOC123714272 [Pieris brassicae]|uniref:uncharacterized protein LOC123714272 n=1 Tax=Pieris brassicae TaxID=7116 RepID=UPI001E660D93|nr:uncharacterized protein LOC123714272 [Pieris brassicae]XP_045524436.1 uncharacterized protein LOC123714272 [Pieris brassicae]
MADGLESGAGLAWRLLATLEGGSLFLATSALIAYTARARVKKHKRRRNVNSVLVTNTTNSLGREVKRRLEACGCVVHTYESSGANIFAKVDALLVIGAETRPGLDGIVELVSTDVYDNLKLLESLSLIVQRGGCIAWASAGVRSDTFSEATHAFDAVLRASLKYVSKKARCEAIWIDRDECVERVADSVIATLVPCDTRQRVQTYPVYRNIAVQISKFLTRWLKKIT